MYVDGRQPACATFSSLILAVTCRTVQDAGAFWRITDMDTYFNTTSSGHPNWSLADTNPQDPALADFEGVLTHELGHWLRLLDLDPAECNLGVSMYTMCGDPGNLYPGTYRYRGLQQDDVDAANLVY